MQGLTREMHCPPASTIIPKHTKHSRNPSSPGETFLSHYWDLNSPPVFMGPTRKINRAGKLTEK